MPNSKTAEQKPKEKVAEEDKGDFRILEFKSEKVDDLYYNHYMMLKQKKDDLAASKKEADSYNNPD